MGWPGWRRRSRPAAIVTCLTSTRGLFSRSPCSILDEVTKSRDGRGFKYVTDLISLATDQQVLLRHSAQEQGVALTDPRTRTMLFRLLRTSGMLNKKSRAAWSSRTRPVYLSGIPAVGPLFMISIYLGQTYCLRVDLG